MLRASGRGGNLAVLGRLAWALRRDLGLVLLVCLLSLPVSPLLGRCLTPDLVVPLLGVACSVLLAFRVNQSHDRWWEARQQWGRLRTASRQWQLSLAALQPSGAGLNPPQRRRLEQRLERLRHRQALLIWTLAAELRPGAAPRQGAGRRALEELQARLEPAVGAGVEPEPAAPPGGPARSQRLLRRQAEEVRALAEEQGLDPVSRSSLTQALTALVAPIGALERLATTPFPAGFHLLARLMVWSFGYLLFLKLETSARTLPQAGLLGAVIMLAVVAAERLSALHDEPLQDRLTGLPLEHYCAAISAEVLGPHHPLAEPPQGPEASVWT